MHSQGDDDLKSKLAALIERIRTHPNIEPDLAAKLVADLERGSIKFADNLAEFVEGAADLERIFTDAPAVEAEQFIRFLAVPDELTVRFEAERPSMPSIFWSSQIVVLRLLGQRIAHEGEVELVPLWFDVYRELVDRLERPD